MSKSKKGFFGNPNVAKASQLVKEAGVLDDARDGGDTIRLWENYREQATLWRALALLQIPATLIVTILALYLAFTRSVTLHVPPKPLPGSYRVDQIHDSEFVDRATNFVNLIATYQSAVARRQYKEALNYLAEPMLSKFRDEMMGEELKAIETTNRTQLFFSDPTKTKVLRSENGKDVQVIFAGERMKIIAGSELPVVTTKFTVTMTTIPHNPFNEHGIVITSVLAENIDAKAYQKE